MHEVKLAAKVFHRLIEIASEHGLERVRRVVLRVNCLESENGVVLSAALKDLSAGTPMADARIEIIDATPAALRTGQGHGHAHDHDHDHDHDDGPGLGEVIIEKIEA